ncbi:MULTISPECIES: hypothetical protein [unclassified Streptomyces]|uniref:hypothetical protein n=1 Tax=unclassified Streptomyces TaxID=2593676 RepID=UPI002E0F3EA6|nr:MULTISPECIES: hypothetical protein [unclassified Streptomyces]WSR27756.1 hypothetical protein OG573_17395 [Streptomyces sp. NBC_01205]
MATTQQETASTRPLDPDDSPSRAMALDNPSQGLLDRARGGWERFLDTFEAAADE